MSFNLKAFKDQTPSLSRATAPESLRRSRLKTRSLQSSDLQTIECLAQGAIQAVMTHLCPGLIHSSSKDKSPHFEWIFDLTNGALFPKSDDRGLTVYLYCTSLVPQQLNNFLTALPSLVMEYCNLNQLLDEPTSAYGSRSNQENILQLQRIEVQMQRRLQDRVPITFQVVDGNTKQYYLYSCSYSHSGECGDSKNMKNDGIPGMVLVLKPETSSGTSASENIISITGGLAKGVEIGRDTFAIVVRDPVEEAEKRGVPFLITVKKNYVFRDRFKHPIAPTPTRRSDSSAGLSFKHLKNRFLPFARR